MIETKFAIILTIEECSINIELLERELNRLRRTGTMGLGTSMVVSGMIEAYTNIKDALVAQEKRRK